MNIPDPFVKITYRDGTEECIPSSGGLRDSLFAVAMELFLKHRPMPDGWVALGVDFKPEEHVDLKVLTDFSEHEHNGKVGVRFKAEGMVHGNEVDVTFSISKKQLEMEEKAYEAFGGGMHHSGGWLKLA